MQYVVNALVGMAIGLAVLLVAVLVEACRNAWLRRRNKNTQPT